MLYHACVQSPGAEVYYWWVEGALDDACVERLLAEAHHCFAVDRSAFAAINTFATKIVKDTTVISAAAAA